MLSQPKATRRSIGELLTRIQQWNAQQQLAKVKTAMPIELKQEIADTIQALRVKT